MGEHSEDILTLFPVILTTDHFAGCVQEGVRLLRVPSPAGKELGSLLRHLFLGVSAFHRLVLVITSLIGT